MHIPRYYPRCSDLLLLLRSSFPPFVDPVRFELTTSAPREEEEEEILLSEEERRSPWLSYGPKLCRIGPLANYPFDAGVCSRLVPPRMTHVP